MTGIDLTLYMACGLPNTLNSGNRCSTELDDYPGQDPTPFLRQNPPVRFSCALQCHKGAAGSTGMAKVEGLGEAEGARMGWLADWRLLMLAVPKEAIQL